MRKTNRKASVRSAATEPVIPTIRKRPPPPDFASPESASSITPPTAVPKSPLPSSQSAKRDYPVGYCQPPEHSRFQKGQSGNPKGRPKGTKALGTIVREQLEAKITVQTPRGRRKVSRIEALLMKRTELATKGDNRSLESLLRLYAEYGPQEVRTEEADNTPLSEGDAAMLELLKDLLRAELPAEGCEEEDADTDPDEGDENIEEEEGDDDADA